MVKAVRIHANGGPEVMCWEEIALPPPGAGEARVRHTAIGINYSDLNVRRGGFYLARPLLECGRGSLEPSEELEPSPHAEFGVDVREMGPDRGFAER